MAKKHYHHHLFQTILAILSFLSHPSKSTPVLPPKCKLTFQNGIVYLDEEKWLNLRPPCHRHDLNQTTCLGIMPSSENDNVIRSLDGEQQDFSVWRDHLGQYVQHSHHDESVSSWKISVRRYLSSDAHDEEGGTFDLKSFKKMSPPSSYNIADSTLIFGQEFTSELNGTNVPNQTSVLEEARNGLASWFPSFAIAPGQDKEGLGMFRLSGYFAGSNYDVERWVYQDDDDFMKNSNDALASGPIMLFNDDCTLMLSPSSSFMSSGTHYDQESRELRFGVLGSVNSIPKSHSTSFMLSSFPIQETPLDGVRRSMDMWGYKLRELHQTVSQQEEEEEEEDKKGDMTARTLQYSTDNGAFYYYKTAKGMNYEDTMKFIKDETISRKIPIQSWLMDSWWYPKGPRGGVISWTVMDRIFPHGIESIQNYTGWYLTAHNRYFSNETVYAKQNNGSYDFIMDGSMALPTGNDTFWSDLFTNTTTRWGLDTYEQDWMYTTNQNMDHLLQDVHAGSKWLESMANAAYQVGITIQYCMTYPRHVLQTLSLPPRTVTQIRASDDYQPDYERNWMDVGITSLFIGALGLTPTKDNFWSCENCLQQRKDKNHTKNHTSGGYKFDTERYSRLHGLISTLTTGPVAPSDRIDLLDYDGLVKKSCDEGGRLLRPDRPGVRVDWTIFGEDKEAKKQRQNHTDKQMKEQVWMAHSKIIGQDEEDDEIQYTYVLSAGSDEFVLDTNHIRSTWSSTSSSVHGQDIIAFHHPVNNKNKNNMTHKDPFQSIPLPITFAPTSPLNFTFTCFAPVLSNGYVFFGEARTKWIAVSSDRFRHFKVWGNNGESDVDGGFAVEVRGEEGEDVELYVRDPNGAIMRIVCRVGMKKGVITMFSTEWMGCKNVLEGKKEKKKESSGLRVSKQAIY